MTVRTLFVSLILAWLLPVPEVHACGVNTNCVIGDRFYRIRMPAKHDGTTPVGAIVFVHGYKGNARNAIFSKGIAAMGRRLNVAILSVKSARDDWSIPGAPAGGTSPEIDELVYFDRVLADAAERHPLKLDRIMVVGSSAGGMMVWNLACHRSHRFAGFVAASGTFWRPIPETCTTPPASVVHVHGTRDRVVPLKGRKVGSNARQGDVREAIAMYARYGGFSAVGRKKIGNLSCENQRNGDGHILNLCLYKGGHTFSIRHVQFAWDMLVEAGKL